MNQKVFVSTQERAHGRAKAERATAHLPSLDEIPLNKNEKSFIFAHVVAEIQVIANNLITISC